MGIIDYFSNKLANVPSPIMTFLRIFVVIVCIVIVFRQLFDPVNPGLHTNHTAAETLGRAATMHHSI